jgi:hypothetical protein
MGTKRAAFLAVLVVVAVAVGANVTVATPITLIVDGLNGEGLKAVACPRDTGCFAVGVQAPDSLNETLVERWNGTRWSKVPSPNPHGRTNSFLNGVACPTSSSCYAVGDYGDYGESWQRTLVERWNGKTWSIVPSPNPPGLPFAHLNGVACPGAANCYAVGAHSSRTGTRALIEHWNGKTWSIVPSPNPHGKTDVRLSGIACPTSLSCDAVGDYSTSSWDRTLVERWSGKNWSIVASPSPSGLDAVDLLIGVACPTSASCYAVGLFETRSPGGAPKPLIEHWNGTSWSVMSSAIPSGIAYQTVLVGVTCTSDSRCYAVGDRFPYGQPFKTLIERWNGTSWSVAPSPSPSMLGSFSLLVGVACPTAKNCHAVGVGYPGKPLAVRWDGKTWAIVPA